MKNSVICSVALITFTGLITVSCSSKAPIAEFDRTADPNVEISRADAAIQQGVVDQLDVMAPKNFSEAVDSLNQAKQDRDHNKDQAKVLHQVALSKDSLAKATDVSKVSKDVLPQVLEARKLAIAAHAPQYFANEFKGTDKDLVKDTKEIEANDTKGAMQDRDKLAGDYSKLELDSIRHGNLQSAKDDLQTSIHEGAEKLAPKTLQLAKGDIETSDRIITADRHNTEAVTSAGLKARMSAARLLRLVRQAKSTTKQTPEEIALQLEKDQIQAESAEHEKTELKEQTELTQNQAQEQLEAKNANIQSLTAANQSLADKNRLESQYASARRMFSDQEAEVYKQGSQLLLRLKGLKFPVNQAVITKDNYPLLAKLQKVIRDTAQSIVIQGNTDSMGSKTVNDKLSQERAISVEKYLVANNSISDDKVTAKGLGDSQPIASNKTAEGRVQNRRIDVIITALADSVETEKK